MTAVAVQQHGGAHRQQYNPRQSPHSSNISSPHQSRPQSYTSMPQAQNSRQELPVTNGNSGLMNPRHAVSNDPVPVTNGNRTPASDSDHRSSTSAGRATPSASDVARDRRRASLQARPTSAPNIADTSPDDSEADSTRRRPKPLLQRAKSDFGPRGEDRDSQVEEEIQDWGARHGFEDHYASEEYVSQLANVSCSFLLLL